MRNLCCLIVFTVMILGAYLTGCSENYTDHAAAGNLTQIQPVKPIIPGSSYKVPPKSEASNVPEPPSESVPSTTDAEPSSSETSLTEQPNVDLDLTKFSANMIYAEIYNMELSPEDYKGKIIKLTGEYVHFPKDVDQNGNPTSEEEVYACMIRDAMACCATGIEFIPEKDSSFWTNAPEDGSEITITGLCDIFLDESGLFTVIQLNNATVKESS